MKVTITADCCGGRRGYRRAELELPASRYEIEDALQRAHVPEGGGYGAHSFEGWPRFLKKQLICCERKTLEELSLLADTVSRMDGKQLATYEGALCLRDQEKGFIPSATMKELINLAFGLDGYEFRPGMVEDEELGNMFLRGEMPGIACSVGSEAAGLPDPGEIGRQLMEDGPVVFMADGYVFPSGVACREVYDGKRLPAYARHEGVLSLRIEKAAGPEKGGVWLELPAGGRDTQRVLEALGEPSFDSCRVAEIKGAIPVSRFHPEGDGDIEKLNALAERVQAMTDSRTLMKYKAALELERCSDPDLALGIADNLGCYAYDPEVISAAEYGEYVLRKMGADPDDPAFNGFDFDGYGERALEKPAACLPRMAPFPGMGRRSGMCIRSRGRNPPRRGC